MLFLKALLIDDDNKLAILLKDYLAKYSIDLVAAIHPDEGLILLEKERPDVVILDVMLPSRDGFTVCKEIRSVSNIPIVMLTARGETTDRIVGLEIGADDYLAKPFEPRELVARLQAVSRRAKGQAQRSDKLVFGPLVINQSERDAQLNGESLNLSTMEFELLNLLASSPGKKFDRDGIMNYLRGFEADVYSRSIDILVSRLRSKLGDDPKLPKYIKTAFGTGYVFIGSNL